MIHWTRTFITLSSQNHRYRYHLWAGFPALQKNVLKKHVVTLQSDLFTLRVPKAFYLESNLKQAPILPCWVAGGTSISLDVGDFFKRWTWYLNNWELEMAGLRTKWNWFNHTLPETNIAPENRPSQKEIAIPTILFQGLVSGRVSLMIMIWSSAISKRQKSDSLKLR